MGHKTALYQAHKSAGAKIVDFGGWDMPLNYGSQIEEHNAVRTKVGIFDVSHMTVVDIDGEQDQEFLQYLLANDVAKLKQTGKALYTGMLNEQGGLIDDLIVYRVENGFRLVVNASTREKDLAWINKQAESFRVQVAERSDLVMIAVQGPGAVATAQKCVDAASANLIADLKPFFGSKHEGRMYCRTGYTGEDGLEIMLPGDEAEAFWEDLRTAGAQPCGLAARDTLRLEAGMNLYGSDMDETTTPLESNMAWCVAWEPAERNFIGRSAIEKQKLDGAPRKLVGLVFRGKGVLRGHQKVITNAGEGEITSGTFSPTLGFSVALARVPKGSESKAHVDMRGRKVEVELVKPPFVRQGKCVFE